MSHPFDVSDANKRELLTSLGLLHSLSRPAQLELEALLQCARVHCLSKERSSGMSATAVVAAAAARRHGPC